MAAMVQQQTPVGLRGLPRQQDQSLPQPKDIPRTTDDDEALASYINTKLCLEAQQPQVPRGTWSYPQSGTPVPPSVGWSQQQQSQYNYYDSTGYDQRSRSPSQPRVSTSNSNPSTVHVTKSSSTPPKRSSQLLMQQQQQHYGRQQHQQHRKVTERPPSLSSTASSSAPSPSPSPSIDTGRRDSVTSVSSSTFSIRSNMSVNSRLSLSKRLRKVFSMSSMRSQPKDMVSGNPKQQGSPRRRSFASFLKKDSNTTPTGLDYGKDRASMTSELPTPTPSSSSTSSEAMSLFQQQQQQHHFNIAPQVGIHYGLPMHASPRLKPAPSSSSSSSLYSVGTPLERRRLHFCHTIQVHETFAAGEYDRRTDSNATCQKMTPMLAMRIKQELNEYKLTEMHVHADSRKYTQFFL